MSDEGGSNQSATAVTAYCKSGCGFFASAQFDGMCSVCYKAAAGSGAPNVALVGALGTVATASGSDEPSASAVATAAAAASVDNLPETEESQMPPPPPAPLPPSAEQQPQEQPAAQSQQLALSVPTPQSINAMLSFPTDEVASSDASSSGCGGGGGSVGGGSNELKRRNRCHTCKKRVGLTGFECRCGGTYCPAHRYSDKHDCSFDYRGHGRHEIRKANPQVLSRKVDRL